VRIQGLKGDTGEKYNGWAAVVEDVWAGEDRYAVRLEERDQLFVLKAGNLAGMHVAVDVDEADVVEIDKIIEPATPTATRTPVVNEAEDEQVEDEVEDDAVNRVEPARRHRRDVAGDPYAMQALQKHHLAMAAQAQKDSVDPPVPIPTVADEKTEEDDAHKREKADVADEAVKGSVDPT